MSEPRPGIPDPSASLDAEIAGCRRLLELLRAEQDALCAADPDALEAITRAKLSQVNLLQDLGAGRSRMLREQGLAWNATGVRALLAQVARPDAARALWDTLVELAAAIQRQTRLNLRLADVRQYHVDRALTVLRNAAGCEATYGADGRSRHHIPPRTLAAI
jgi:flagellar biosynthesis/type III secretory pathway chaperone